MTPSGAVPVSLDVTDYAGILVDVDGTLVDSSEAIATTWTAFADRHGLDPVAVIRAAQGRPAPETAAALVPGVDVAAETRRLEESELADTAGTLALPGALALLGARLPLAVVTSGTRRLATARLRGAGLPVPDTLIAFDDVEVGKPAPDPYLLGADRLGVDPTACLVLEDAPAGIAAGRAAGARVIAVRTTHADAELVDADAILDSLAGLRVPAR